MLIPLLRLIPKNLVSFLFGRLAYLRLPSPIAHRAIELFCRFYRVNIGESAQPISHFRSLGDFFIRDLNAGARPLGEGIASPADGRLTQVGAILNGRIEQIKGIDYSVLELVQDRELASLYQDGTACVIYLSPPDYHHVHSPVDGEVRGFAHIPGNLWPVNGEAIAKIPRLFAINERVVVPIHSALGVVTLVFVGAMNVGSIGLEFSPFRSNQNPFEIRPSGPKFLTLPQPFNVSRGDKLGTFYLGSTVVLLFEPGRAEHAKSAKIGPIQVRSTLFR